MIRCFRCLHCSQSLQTSPMLHSLQTHPKFLSIPSHRLHPCHQSLPLLQSFQWFP